MVRHKIIIIGSGFGGIGMGIGLRKAGFDDFVILEKATEPALRPVAGDLGLPARLRRRPEIPGVERSPATRSTRRPMRRPS